MPPEANARLNHFVRRVLVFFFCAFGFCATRAGAQEQYSRWEVGGYFTALRPLNQNDRLRFTPGFGASLDYNLNRRLAFETQVDFFPQYHPSQLQKQTGTTLEALFGIRGKAIQTKRFAIYGLLRPGILHFDGLFVETDATPPAVIFKAPADYFVLNLGGGVEYYLARRWVARFEISGNPYRIGNSTTTVLGASVFQPGLINDALRMSAGLEYRLGELRPIESESEVPGRLEFGPQFTAMSIHRTGPLDGVRTDPGAGGFVSYKILPFLFADGALIYYPRDTRSSDAHDGGRILQGVFGARVGVRKNHFGIFGKARPGFNSYSRALTGMTSSWETFARSTNFVLNLGGVLEFYTTKRSVLRIDAGDTHIYFADKTLTFPTGTVTVPGGSLQHSLELTVGYGWRF
jgi:Outer membrane protein beta-barrel domain